MLSKQYYEVEPIVSSYAKTLARVLGALNHSPSSESLSIRSLSSEKDHCSVENKTTSRAARLAQSIILFEKKLASACLDLEILYTDPFFTYNSITIASFSARLPEIDFGAYFFLLGVPPTFGSSHDSTVIVSYPPYIESLSSLLRETSAETLESYLVTRVAPRLGDYLSSQTEVWRAKRELDELLDGLKRGAVGWREDFCLKRVEGALGFASGRFFVWKVFGGESRAKVTRVVEGKVFPFDNCQTDLVGVNHL